MAKIELSVEASYAPDWKAWQGIRELVQNAVDADDEGYTMSVTHHGNKLVIKNSNVVLDTRVLLLGGTMGKAATARGKHREGLKIGLLALVRSGCQIAIFNGDEVWRPAIESSEKFSGSNVLVINTRKLQVPREDFAVEVEGIDKEVWEALRKRFLFLKKPDPSKTVKVERGTVLLQDEYKGAIFCRGIFVCEMKNLDRGYDLPRLALDRDRQVVDAWDLRFELAQLWDGVVEDEPERFVSDIYQRTKGNASEELMALRHYGTEKLAKALRKELETEHGEGAIPVSSAGEAQRVEELGGKAVLVDPGFKELLEKDGKTSASLQEAMKRGIRERFKISDLTADEAWALNNVVARVAKLDEVGVVNYNDATLRGQYDSENHLFQIARASLTASHRDLLRMVVAQAAIHRGKHVDEIYLDLLMPEVVHQRTPSRRCAGFREGMQAAFELALVTCPDCKALEPVETPWGPMDPKAPPIVKTPEPDSDPFEGAPV